jgi:hypothetical protein
MLTPPVLVRRWPVGLVSSVAALAFSAGLLAARSTNRAIERPAPEPPRVVCAAAPPTAPILTATVSPRFQTIDLLSPDAYRADAVVDEVFDVELRAPLAVTHIFVNGNGGSHQWDTVIGATAIPFGRVFGNHRGDVTWHLGVRENGDWITSPENGSLRVIPQGTHHLELIATGVADGPSPRTVTVMFVDGTTLTAAVGGNPF